MTARRRPGSVTDWRPTLPCGICPPLLAPSITAQSARRAPPVYSGSRWRTGPVRGASHDRDQDVFIHSGDGQLAPHQGPVPLPAGVGQRAPSRMCAGAPGLAHGVGGAESPSGCRETSVRGPSAGALPGAVSSHRRLLSPRPEMGTEVASGLWEEVTVFKGLSFSIRLFNFITFAVCLTRRKCVFILSGGS